jgi:hypothetical protein
MRKALMAATLAGVLLLVAVALGRSNEYGGPTIDPLREAQMDAQPGETGETIEPEPIQNGGFTVEVLVGGRPLEEYYARGRRYVEALEGSEYELRVTNPLPMRVAVALSVDGLNTIDARRSTAWDSSKWVIEPYGSITIRGWQMSGVRARRFYFTSESDSYGAKLGQTANLGSISAVFFRERAPIAVIPRPRPVRPLGEDERSVQSNRSDSSAADSASRERGSSNSPSASAGSSAAKRSAEAYPTPDDDYAATGIGRSVRHDVSWINMELDRRPAAELSLRYEYHDALVRLGVIPRPYPRPDTLNRRERSTGFDDRRYSPEP